MGVKLKSFFFIILNSQLMSSRSLASPILQSVFKFTATHPAERPVSFQCSFELWMQVLTKSLLLTSSRRERHLCGRRGGSQRKTIKLMMMIFFHIFLSFWWVLRPVGALYSMNEKIAYLSDLLIPLTHGVSEMTQMITCEHISRNEGGREDTVQWKQEKLKSLKTTILIS